LLEKSAKIGRAAQQPV